jgi:hypothetical protein
VATTARSASVRVVIQIDRGDASFVVTDANKEATTNDHEGSDREGSHRQAEADARPAIIAAGVPLATSLKGKTPGQTFYSVLYAEASA